MIFITFRKYATLAEVTRKEEENKRLSEYRANRVKALMFKQVCRPKVSSLTILEQDLRVCDCIVSEHI